MGNFFADPGLTYAGIAALVCVAIVLIKVFSKIISKFG